MQGKNKPGNGCNHSQPGNQHSDREREMVCGHRGSEQIMLMMQCSTVWSDPERRVTCPLRRGCPSVPLHTQTCLRLKQLLFLCVSEMQSKGQASVESKWSRVRQKAGTTYFMTTEKNRHSKRFCICGSTCTALLFLVRWCSYHRVRLHYTSRVDTLKGKFTQKFCHNLFTLSPFQMCMTYFLLQNTKEGILKNVPVFVQ